jgi:hypothetical protein
LLSRLGRTDRETATECAGTASKTAASIGRTRHALAAAKARGTKLGNLEQVKINRAKATAQAQALRPSTSGREDFSIRHLVMPNHVGCCVSRIRCWNVRVPAAPVNVMEQFHPDSFCDPASAK